MYILHLNIKGTGMGTVTGNIKRTGTGTGTNTINRMGTGTDSAKKGTLPNTECQYTFYWI